MSENNLYKYPEYPHAQQFESQIHKMGWLTSERPLRTNSDGAPTFERPLAIRNIRARLRHELLGKRNKDSVDYLDIKESAIKARRYDQIAEQFIEQQHDMKVDLGELGEQSARYVILKLEPPLDKPLVTDKARDHKTIFLIPGISNDLDGAGMLGHQLAVQGDTVVISGFPDSWYGSVTDAFGEATDKGRPYESHTAFFNKMIQQIMETPEFKAKAQDPENMELWGFSTGAAIVAELLKKAWLQLKTKRAVLLAPPSCVEQPMFHAFGKEIPMPVNIVREYLQLLADYKHYPALNPAHRTLLEKSPEARRLQLKTHYALRRQVLKEYPWWNGNLKVKTGGSITMISGDHDSITNSIQAHDKIHQQNPEIELKVLKNASHNTLLTQPQRVIELLGL